MNHKFVLKLTSGVLLATMLVYTSPVLALTKEETVYSKWDVTGNCYQTIVNNHLKNEEQVQVIQDLSDLVNVQNVNGTEEFNQEGTSLVWQANGSDIYYQGDSSKDLPIACEVTYTLDGNAVSAKELVGKSGRVKITLAYTNNDAHWVSLNGKSETLFTPFVVVAGTILDNTTHKNVQITNGKVIDDGTKTTVIGLCLPGLQDSLGIAKDTFCIPSSIEISMDATDFELNSIATFVTPKLIEDTDLSLFDKLNTVYEKINTLECSSKQLVNGANSLKNGASTYHEKSSEFHNVMKQFSSFVSNANASYSKINSGIDVLNKNSSILQSGAKNVSEGALAISSNLNTIDQKLGELQAGIKALESGEKQLENGLDSIVSSISKANVSDSSAKIAELQKLVQANTSTRDSLKVANKGLTAQLQSVTDDKLKASLKAQIENNQSLIGLLETNIKATNSTIASLKATDSSMIKELQAGLSSLQQGLTTLQTGTKNLYDGTIALKSGTNTLVTKSTELYEGTKSLYEGSVKMTEGTKSLRSGSNEMKSGLSSLDSSSQKLTQANLQLVDGASSLSSGASTLADGMVKFDKEGVQLICDYLNSNLKECSTRLEKLEDLASEYNHFTMLQDGCNGSVKFIILMDSIKKEAFPKEEVVLNSDKEENE